MKSTNAPIRRLLTSIFDFGFLRLVGFFFFVLPMMFSPPLYDTIIPHILVVVKKIPEKISKKYDKKQASDLYILYREKRR